MQLSGRRALVDALEAVGERLASDGVTCALVVVGGAALNLLRIVDRPTIDVDVLASVGSDGETLQPPDPLPEALRRAVVAVAHDRGLADDWVNTAVADSMRRSTRPVPTTCTSAICSPCDRPMRNSPPPLEGSGRRMPGRTSRQWSTGW